MKCAYHPEREAVGTCVNCGKNVCRYCRSYWNGQIYCPRCFPVHSMPVPGDEDIPKAVTGARKDRSRLAAVFLILLSGLTYLPLLLTWDGESPYFMALLGVAIVSFFFQASLAVGKTGWAWWGSAVSWLVAVLIVVVAYAYEFDPSGMLPAVAVVVVGTPAGVFLLWGKVSKKTAITVPLCVMGIVAIILLLYVRGTPILQIFYLLAFSAYFILLHKMGNMGK